MSQIKQLGIKVLSSLDQANSEKALHLTSDEIENIRDEQKTASSTLEEQLALIKLSLYIQARNLKSSFLEEAYLQAKKENEFFKFTINVFFRKDIFDFDELKSTSPEKSGTLESIYWAKRDGRKINGKVKYFQTRIPINDPEGIKYKRKAFTGGQKWQIDLVMKYEEKFAEIRKACKVVGEIKRKIKHLNIYYGSIHDLFLDKTTDNLKSDVSNAVDDIEEI